MGTETLGMDTRSWSRHLNVWCYPPLLLPYLYQPVTGLLRNLLHRVEDRLFWFCWGWYSFKWSIPFHVLALKLPLFHSFQCWVPALFTFSFGIRNYTWRWKKKNTLKTLLWKRRGNKSLTIYHFIGKFLASKIFRKNIPSKLFKWTSSEGIEVILFCQGPCWGLL